MLKFHETVMGKRFFEKQLPDLIKALEKIGSELEKMNKKIDGEKVEYGCISTPKCEKYLEDI